MNRAARTDLRKLGTDLSLDAEQAQRLSREAEGNRGADGLGEAPRVLNALAFGPAAEASLARWCDAIAAQSEGW